ncbi:MAG: amino acid-binding protein [Oscillospiraceae bacterium]|jgi:hypothetical protein|nr:amino acid-binding protein [Oscillospiraceae bacterium]
MSVRQISVFIENSPGKLAAFTRLLGEGNIDLLALTIADTTSFGILRCLVADPDEACRVITKAGYSARLTDVLAAVVPDKPGGLADVLITLADEGVSLEYCYSFARETAGQSFAQNGGAALVLRVDDLERATLALSSRGVPLINQDQIAALRGV